MDEFPDAVDITVAPVGARCYQRYPKAGAFKNATTKARLLVAEQWPAT